MNEILRRGLGRCSSTAIPAGGSPPDACASTPPRDVDYLICVRTLLRGNITRLAGWWLRSEPGLRKAPPERAKRTLRNQHNCAGSWTRLRHFATPYRCLWDTSPYASGGGIHAPPAGIIIREDSWRYLGHGRMPAGHSSGSVYAASFETGHGPRQTQWQERRRNSTLSVSV